MFSISVVILNSIEDLILDQVENDIPMFLKDLLFPRFCLNCRKFGKYICEKCREGLAKLPDQGCIYCFRTSYLGQTHLECKQENGVDGLISIFKYNNLLKKIIKAIKYRLTTDVLIELIPDKDRQIANSLNFFKNATNPLFFQAIPLHPKRFRERGFNQAKLIIKRLKKPVSLTEVEYLVRTKNTLPQAQITDRQERVVNTQGAFWVPKELSEKVVGKNFFLVDDVVTTGSTVKEAARTLKLQGAAKVYVFSLAKG